MNLHLLWFHRYRLTTKKGLAGVGPAEISMFSSDLDELGIGSTTYNIDEKQLLHRKLEQIRNLIITEVRYIILISWQ